MSELKGSAEKLSSLSSEEFIGKARQTLLNRNSVLPDLKAIESNAPLGNEQELLVELISSEVGSWKKDLVDNYMKIAEKAEKELQHADTEKTQLLAINQRLLAEVGSLKAELRTAIESRAQIELNLNHYLTEFEVQAEQLARVRENYDKYEKLHGNIERTLKSQLQQLTEESETKIAELTSANQRLTADKAALLKDRTQNVSAQLTNEEFQKYQADQIAELTLRNSKLSLENEEIKAKLSKLVQENIGNLDKLNTLQDEIHRLTNEYEMRLDQVTKTYELRLKTDATRKVSDGPKPQGDGQGRFSDLYALQIPEYDAEPGGLVNLDDPSFYERDRTTTDLDRLNIIRSSNFGMPDPSRKPTNLGATRPPAESTFRKPTNLGGPSGVLPAKESTLIRPPVITVSMPKAPKPDVSSASVGPSAALDDDYDPDRSASGPNFLVPSSEDAGGEGRRDRAAQRQTHRTPDPERQGRRPQEQGHHQPAGAGGPPADGAGQAAEGGGGAHGQGTPEEHGRAAAGPDPGGPEATDRAVQQGKRPDHAQQENQEPQLYTHALQGTNRKV